jgi:hypothetical protein
MSCVTGHWRRVGLNAATPSAFSTSTVVRSAMSSTSTEKRHTSRGNRA